MERDGAGATPAALTSSVMRASQPSCLASVGRYHSSSCAMSRAACGVGWPWRPREEADAERLSDGFNCLEG